MKRNKVRISRSLLVGFAAICVAAPRSAAAQATSPIQLAAPPGKSFGQVHLGRVLFTPGWQLTQFGIDTNVFNLDGTSRRPADFTATVRLQEEGRYAGRRFDFRALALADYVYYARYGSERAFNPQLALTSERRIGSHLGLYASMDLGFTKERGDVEIDRRTRQQRKTVLVGGRWKVSKLEFGVHGQQTSLGYDSD